MTQLGNINSPVPITANQLQDGLITSDKIADSQITEAKVANSAITSVKIGDGQVTEAKVANSAITSVKIGDSQITAVKIATNAVETAKIANANVTSAKLETAVARGVAKAWARINGAATPTLADTFNISSLTDSGVGLYDLGLTNSMSGTSYNVVGGSLSTGASQFTSNIVTSGWRNIVRLTSDGSTASDSSCAATAHGDLA